MNARFAADKGVTPSICFVGINNLAALAPEFREHGMGGAELQQTLLAKALVRKGFSVSMVVADLGQPDGAEWYGVKTYKAYKPNGGIPGPRFIHPRWTGVWAALNRSKAHIRYSSCAGLLPGQLAMYTQRHPGKVVFRVAHDTDCQPDKLLIPNWRSKALYRYGLQRVNLILAQTSYQQSEMKKNFGRDSRVIPSLLELPTERKRITERTVDALWVSNLRTFKRPELALNFATQCPEIGLHMIGGTQPGVESYYEDIRKRATTIRNLTFHGPLPYEVVNTHIAHTKVLINTSESEGFPNTYLQAWARGTPVVGFFDPDGVIAREGLGRTVNNVDQLKAAVKELISDRELWSAMSERCFQYASTTHVEKAVDSYVTALLSLYETS